MAGLGRAPVLVAIALIESGVKYEDAVDMIRQVNHAVLERGTIINYSKVRRGALNKKQLDYLSKYKSSGELKRLANGKSKENCAIM